MTVARPFPLPSDMRAANILARAGAAHLRAFITGKSPEREAKAMFGADFVLKAATGPATIGTAAWAGSLAPVSIYGLVADITSISAAAALIDRGLKLDMDGIAELRVPGRMVNAAAAGLWTSEEAPIVARQLSFANTAVLQPRKLSVIIVVTREMAQSSNIEAIVRQTLGEAAGLALDTQMFSATAGTASAPAGLFNGITGQTPTAGGGSVAMMGDLKNLFTALAAAGGGKTAVIIAALPQATTLKMTVGPQFDIPILGSTGLAAGTVAVVESASFVSGFSSVPEFNASNQAIYQAEDTSPADPIMSGPPVRSLFQTDGIGLKMDLWAAYGLRAAGHAQFVSSVTW